MIQFQNDHVVAELVNNGTAILTTWKGFVPSHAYRDALTRALEIAKKHKIKFWISDIRSMKVLGVKDQQWAATEWLSNAVSADCYRKQAVIMSEDIFGQASAKNILTTAQNQEIEIQNFTRIEDAKKWLAASASSLAA